MKNNPSQPSLRSKGRGLKERNQAFTLVELIVVITILAILGTIAFLSFQGYSRDARDSVRISDLSNIHKQLELMIVKSSTVFIPENKVDITASGTVILYQGEMGQDTLNKLKVNNGGLDPVDQTPYTYSTTKNLKQYELMGFLENGNKVAYQVPSPLRRGLGRGFLPQANAAANLTNRFPITKGDSIGIILDPTTNTPIQSTGTGVDIVNTNVIYDVYFNNSTNGIISGTGVELKHIEKPLLSCNSILKTGGSNGDGIYKIDPNGTGSFDVYCDMTTDGGGWTKVNKKLLGSELFNNTISTISDINNGSNITVSISDASCYVKKSHLIYIADIIKWSRIRFTQEFYGGTSCWGIFGDRSNTSDSIYNYQNLVKFSLGINKISNQIKMNTATDNIFDGITNRCDNNIINNFWEYNKGSGLRSVNVILEKSNLNNNAGLYTDLYCSTIPTKWIYKDIFVK